MKEIFIDINDYNKSFITATENDNNSDIYKIIITEDARRFDLTGKTVQMAYAISYTDKGDILNLNVTNPTEGEITLEITNELTRKDGDYTCQLLILGENEYRRHSKYYFNLSIRENLFNKISGEIIESPNLGILQELIKKAEFLNTQLENNSNLAETLNTNLNENINIAEPLNNSLNEKNSEAATKNIELKESIEDAKKFIEGLDESQNIPQLRLDVTKLQNNMKTNQSLEYEGSSIRCENTLEGRTENMKIKGITLLNYARTNTPVIIPTGYRIPIDYLGLEKGETYSFYVTYLPNGATWSVNNPSIDTSFTEDNLKVRTLSKEFDNNFKSISIKCSNITLEEAKKTKLIILKGDWRNKEIPTYFEGILSMAENEKEEEKHKILFLSSNGDKVDRKTILINHPLRGLNEFRDTISEVDGEVQINKNIDMYSFTGEEEVRDTTAVDETSGTGKYMVFALTVSKTINRKTNINNLFPTKEFGLSFQKMDSEGLAVTQYGVYIKILKSKLSTQNVEGFKAWLKSNPTTIYYALENPIIEKVSDSIDIDLDTFFNTTNFNIENNIKGLLEFKVPSNLASVIQSNSKSINEIYDLINKTIIPALVNTNKSVALATLKNNLK